MKAFCIGPNTSVAGRGFLSRVRILASRIQGQNDTGYTKNLDLIRIPNPGSQIRILLYAIPDPGGPKSIGSWIRNSDRYHGKARNTVKIELYQFEQLEIIQCISILKISGIGKNEL
jgi:hypothetical protein